MKSVQIRNYFSSVFRAFRKNAEVYGVNLRMQSEYNKIRTRNNSVFGHFHAVRVTSIDQKLTNIEQKVTVNLCNKELAKNNYYQPTSEKIYPSICSKLAAPDLLEINKALSLSFWINIMMPIFLFMTSPIKILSSDSNDMVDVVMWRKFSNPSISTKDVLINWFL